MSEYCVSNMSIHSIQAKLKKKWSIPIAVDTGQFD